jgi:hypothetical protein
MRNTLHLFIGRLAFSAIVACSISSCGSSDNQGKGNDSTAVDSSKILPPVTCACQEGVSSKATTLPTMVLEFTSQLKIAVCGEGTEKLGENRFRMKGFDIFDCKSGKSLVSYGAYQHTEIEQTGDSLKVVEVMNLPVGEDWALAWIPFSERTLKGKDSELVMGDLQPIMKVEPVPAAKLGALMKEVKASKEATGEAHIAQVNKLLVAAVGGAKDAEKTIRDYYGVAKVTTPLPEVDAALQGARRVLDLIAFRAANAK